MVDLPAAHLEEEAAGEAARHTAAVNGGGKLKGTERQLHPAAQVALDGLHPGGGKQRVAQIRCAADGGSGAAGDVHRVSQMVAVAVGDEDVICLHLVGRNRRQGIAGKEGIRQQLVLSVIQQKACVAQKSHFHHKFLLLFSTV